MKISKVKFGRECGDDYSLRVGSKKHALSLLKGLSSKVVASFARGAAEVGSPAGSFFQPTY